MVAEVSYIKESEGREKRKDRGKVGKGADQRHGSPAKRRHRGPSWDKEGSRSEATAKVQVDNLILI